MNPTNKRVRFDDPPDLNTPILLTAGVELSPKASSLLSVRTFAATLQKHLSPIYLSAGLSHIEHLHSWSTKVRQYSKMADDIEFIPRSARLVDFVFHVSKQVEASPEFLGVQAETNVMIADFRLDLKVKVMQTLQIQINLLRESLYKNLAKELFSIVQATLVSKNNKAKPHVIMSSVIYYHYDELMSEFDASKDEFCKLYKELHALPQFPLANAQPTDADATMQHVPGQTDPSTDLVTHDTIADEEPPGPAPGQSIAIHDRDLARTCFQAITSVIRIPHANYFKREEEIEISISLKKLRTETETEDAAAAAKARLDLEESAPPELVKDLIRGQVSAENKNLKAELGQLKRQMAALSNKTGVKNTRRGPKGGASTSKQITKNTKNPKKKKTTRTSQKNGAPASVPAVDAAANDTQQKKGRKSPKKKKTKKAQRS